ncbi:hypothetical protein RRG08_005004 [Elysia crispata]|uniref:CUB domain-containing protein n=1 Tax=Elysia crispata TaxID=231223 RepID=A0AAE1A900_9GAST|nr:hypothetical protein RRG08_005004 [Elysia crispata]
MCARGSPLFRNPMLYSQASKEPKHLAFYSLHQTYKLQSEDTNQHIWAIMGALSLICIQVVSTGNLLPIRVGCDYVKEIRTAMIFFTALGLSRFTLSHCDPSVMKRRSSELKRSLFLITIFCLVVFCRGCDQILSGNEGTVQSPNYPNDYPNHARCGWTIRTDPGTRVTLKFTSFMLEESGTCRYDSLQIRDGNNRSSALLNKLCGEVRPDPITASGNVMYLEFRSDGSQTRNGFRAQWSIGCNWALTGNGGIIQSPSYPNGYPNNARCVWTIETDPGTQISLNFTAFSLEDGGCQYDTLEIRDGNNQCSPLLNKLCGAAIPNPITASGNVMFLEFHSDGSMTENGFWAQWSADNTTISTNMPTPEVPSSTVPAVPSSTVPAVCGKILTGNGGIFQSPNFPGNYPDNTRCVWTITTDPGFQVHLNFSEFSLEEANGCSFDYVFIRDGNNQSAEMLTKKCGFSIPCPITSTGNEMFIEFRSDGSVTKSGFQATWSADNTTISTNMPTPTVPSSTVPPVCGKILTGNGGIFQSPNFPGNYPDNTRCVWTITTDPGFQVHLNFSEFSLEEANGCSFDYVFIRDGNNQSAEMLTKKCGFSIPCPITSTGNEMFIEFRSDGSVTKSGFQATWSADNTTISTNMPNPTVPSSTVPADNTTISTNMPTPTVPSSTVPPVCGQIMSGNGGIFQSPNFPGNYPDNTRCVWNITADPGFQVHLNFSEFSLEEKLMVAALTMFL